MAGEILGYGILAAGGLGVGFYVRRKGSKGKYKKYEKYGWGIALIGVLCFAAAIWETVSGQSKEVYKLERNGAGEGAKEIWLSLEAGELLEQQTFPVIVEEQLLTKEEAERLLNMAGREAETAILGANSSGEQITSDLYLPKMLQKGTVEASYYFEPFDLIEPDGTILWDSMEEDEALVKVSAELRCQEYQVMHEFYIRLLPKMMEEKTALLLDIRRRIARENQKTGESYVQLPETYQDVDLNWKEEPENLSLKLLLLGLACMVLWHVSGKEKQERLKKALDRQMKLDYPDIVIQISLLTGAGMTVSSAWGRIVSEYGRQREYGVSILRPGFEEMKKTWREIQDGVGEQQAYGNFGVRCGQAQYRKFASILMQNVKKGTKGMQQLLDAEAKEAFVERKRYAKQLGEEASTKLLIPMGLMLLLVFAILMLPAMMNLRL
ncbi:MAG: hypothetical protein HFI76_07565 [Lachnospiraceae bacterium]|nr:hypothetical protein [Lachnospiraceae bacterium]